MRFLSDEWIARQADGSVDPTPGAFSGTVLTIVTGGPDGEVRYLSTFADGRVVAAEPGDAGEWLVSCTLGHDDARAVLDGEADLNALFMSGRMKVAGDATAPLVALLRATKLPAAVAGRADLAALTD